MGSQARIEEMVNYFDYSWPAPEASATAPFQVTTAVHAAPWDPTHRLAVIGVKAKEAMHTDRGNNIVLLVDVSGSMADPDKLPLLAQSLSKMMAKLGSQDRVSLVTYADGDKTVFESVPGSDHDAIVTALDALTSGGGTDGSQGLKTAYDIAQKHFIPGGNNRVLLATDGDFNLGTYDVDELKAWISQARENDIFDLGAWIRDDRERFDYGDDRGQWQRQLFLHRHRQRGGPRACQPIRCCYVYRSQGSETPG
jgi:Ca-activated chloride channel family protein